ncbi:hypothetical protein BP6252_10191 [Coleophoma cylindrospora]|uniref:FAD-binding PCMH-type domain-containing protein n=1 Tax=Coleophoma cylindrospora TaxID=1849047 RepID=A0A3D8QXP4_9HELO|nr:hypothetical protein BP6252_10191 [Coleophoma cylindrospora]
MAMNSFPLVVGITAIAITIATVFIMGRLRVVKKVNPVDLTSSVPEHAIRLRQRLALALPESVLLPHDTAAFERSRLSYWAQQAYDVVPACVVRPRDVHQLSTAITILKREYDEQQRSAGEDKKHEALFAVRAGGHSPVALAASIPGGVVIDLSHFDEVTPSKDETSVVIGAGAKWGQVSRVLDEKGLAVVGGRNSNVGVGGLTLGAGLSFFTPRFGLVGSNVLSYEIVLASGSVATASASHNRELWLALNGGANNFGIVTRFTTRAFPCGRIWGGFLYMPARQSTKVLAAFYDVVRRADPSHPGTSYDPHAAGPLASFTFLQPLGLQAVAVNLVHTDPPETEKKWPVYWEQSPFKPIWRLWSTCKVRTLTSATDELHALNPPGRRQVFGTTTIKNDPATLAAAHKAYHDAIASIRRANIKGLSWTLVLQPLAPEWVRKGNASPHFLRDATDEPLVIVSFTNNWVESRDDAFVQQTTRHAIEQIDAFAAAHGTGHRFRFLNYCADWQKPFEGYGEENLRFLREVSTQYDPDGLFQKGCAGGFKLGMGEGKPE